MNPVMERFFGQHGVTSTHRQTLKYLPLPREADLFVQYLHVEMWFSFLNGHDHAAIPHFHLYERQTVVINDIQVISLGREGDTVGK